MRTVDRSRARNLVVRDRSQDRAVRRSAMPVTLLNERLQVVAHRLQVAEALLDLGDLAAVRVGSGSRPSRS